MRPLVLALPLALLGARLSAQAVERSDIPARGQLRLSFDPRIETWIQSYGPSGLAPLGAPLTGDSVGATFSAVARLQQDIRNVIGVPGFVASLGKAALNARAERRSLALRAEYGLTDRLALQVFVPVVHVLVRAAFRLDSTGANLGANPRFTQGLAADSSYAAFFTHFGGALGTLQSNIAGGKYGCPSSPQCAQAQALLAQGQAVYAALHRGVYGVGTDSSAQFLPLDSSDAGRAVFAKMQQIEQQLAADSAGSFTDTLLLPDARVDPFTFDELLVDSTFGFETSPFADTPRFDRWWLGDVEVGAKYKVATGPRYAAAVAFVLRLPTGHRDSPHNPLDIATGDHQLDEEVRFIQELTLAQRIWLNLSLRATHQNAAPRDQLVAPAWQFLPSPGSFATLNWKPGDYVAADFAPMYKLAPNFAAGVALSYLRKNADAYTYQSAADSIALAARVGTPVPASILDANTAERLTLFGGTVSYFSDRLDANATIQHVVGGAGGAPAETVFKLELRTTRWPF